MRRGIVLGVLIGTGALSLALPPAGPYSGSTRATLRPTPNRLRANVEAIFNEIL